MLILALQLVGSGSLDAEIFPGFLDLPNGSSMRGSTFHRVKQKLGPIICEIAKEEIKKR